MLTGRESLKRLIGKRRRFLPSRESFLSSPLPQSSLNLLKNEEEEINDDDDGGKADRLPPQLDTVKNGVSEWVSCPICGARVRSFDDVINSHLDSCLARGTKRKLSQPTLFQLNFCSRSKLKFQSIESNYGENFDIVHANLGDNSVCNADHELDHMEDAEEDSRNEPESRLESFFTDSEKSVGYPENPDGDEETSNGVDSSSLPLEGVMSAHDMEESEIDVDLLEMSFNTFIVGRRFSDQLEINPEMKLIFCRDPKNMKDRNAIKVLSADRGFSEVAGFLPQELAQYLSPLIDKFNLSLEGHVTSVPKHSLAAVPIHIVCRNQLIQGEESSESLKLFKSLWKDCVLLANSALTSSSGMSRYQQNLTLLIQEVLRTNSHILIDGEKAFLEKLTLLSDDSQRLFARLYTRKGPWFRMSNILYSEILDIEGAIKELSEAGYIYSLGPDIDIHDDDLKEILNVLNVGELQEMNNILISETSQRVAWPNGKRQTNRTKGMKKQDLIGLLLSSHEKNKCSNLPKLIQIKTAGCIRVAASAESLIWRAERLFFLNGEQDLSAFLLVDFGIVKYPTYNCMQSDQIFRNRSELLSYEEAIEVAQIMDESLDANSSEMVTRCIEVSDSRISSSSGTVQSSTQKSMDTFFSCFKASWVYSKVVLLGVSFLEREQRYNDAINLLKQLLFHFPSDRRRGYWTIRLSVNLEHVERVDESLQVAEDGLLDTWVRAGSRVALQRRVLRLGRPPRRWRIPSYSKSLKRKITEVHVQGRPLKSKTGMRNIFYGEDGEQCGVEQLALQYYAGEGGAWQGVHTESGIWLTIFGLLMWDAIFADVPNAFCTKFQTAPLDLETDCFYESRKKLIEDVLEKIEDGMGEEILILSWESHLGTMCRGVNWERHSLAELRAAVTCVGGPCLASVFRHLAQDYRSWSSGMPDLLLWRFHDNYKGEAKLVEVKGPRDRLSEQQRAWLLFLMDCGFNVEVCKVTAPVLK